MDDVPCLYTVSFTALLYVCYIVVIINIPSHVVHVSKTPGCTRSVNYYTLFKSNNNHICYFVDLPGYGYARASKTDQAKWKEIIQNYLTSRDFTVLRRVYVMIDSRHGIRPTDLTMLKLLTEARLSHQVGYMFGNLDFI